MKQASFSNHDAIAVIGMGARFPKARNIEQFWQNLRDGVEMISFFSEEELKKFGVDQATVASPNYVKAKAYLEDIDLFDASFFGYTPREAELMDPQQRLFLECAWEALEHSGYDPQTFPGHIGVYAGARSITRKSSYFFAKLVNGGFIQTKDVNLFLYGNNPAFLSTRVSYKLNLKGPSLNVQTACSTSLVAVHLACEALQNRDCDIALAGAVSVGVYEAIGYHYQQGGIYSPDGHCRAFDANAEGTLEGDGVGAIVLKRLQDAIEDGDQVWAVIRGTAVNNDGSEKTTYTAPSIDGQAEVIIKALDKAQLKADTITYIEAHGTGTALGDPIEVTALTKAFQTHTQKNKFCAIGSVKTNMGHLYPAAGIAGMIKVILALKHKQIPPSLHFDSPNPNINFEESPFYVSTALSEWKSNGHPRRAGISSFGFGGTNAHVILEEAPELKEGSLSKYPYELLLLSAKTETAVDHTTTNLATFLKDHPTTNPADVAYTLKVGRQAFACRRIMVVQNTQDAVEVIEQFDRKRILTQISPNDPPSVIFMFPGGGSQYPNMGRDLYEHEPVYRQQIDLCLDLLKTQTEIDLQHFMFPPEDEVEIAAQTLQQPLCSIVSVFITNYALAKLWLHWGIQPETMIGHSVGEYVAACLAGVISLEDALSIVLLRGKLFETLPEGAMVSVPLPEKDLQPLLVPGVSIAAINHPDSCVISGEVESLEKMERTLAEKGVNTRRLKIDIGAHSSMLDPILEEFEQHLNQVQFHKPKMPYISNVTGTWIKPEEATHPRYWVQHLRHTVRFAAGIETLIEDRSRLFLEAGPGHTLSTLVRKHPQRSKEQLCVSSLPHPKEKGSDLVAILTALGKLWMANIKIDWSGFYADQHRYRLPLPTYPFERKRYWLDSSSEGVPTSFTEVHPLWDSSQAEISTQIHHSRPALETSYVAPRNPLEEQLSDIWQQLFGIDQVGIHDNFFELGGDSFLVIQVVSKAEETGVLLSPQHIFLHQTIAELAEIMMASDYE